MCIRDSSSPYTQETSIGNNMSTGGSNKNDPSLLVIPKYAYIMFNYPAVIFTVF